MKVVVLGAGIVGAAVAAELSQTGSQVILLDAAAPGAGTTSTSYAWVNANSKEPKEYFDLNHAGMREHHELSRATGCGAFQPSGNLEWAVSSADKERLADRMSRLQEWGYSARWLTHPQAADLVRDANIPQNADYALFPDEGFCHPIQLLGQLIGRARDHDCHLITAFTVNDLSARQNGVSVSGRHDGSAVSIDADVVVSCLGRWTSSVLAGCGVNVPMLSREDNEGLTLGYLGTTTPTPVRLDKLLTTPGLNVRPAGGGRLLLQALDLDPGSSAEVTPRARTGVGEVMLARLGDMMGPVCATAEIQVVLGERAMPADGLTIAGFTESIPHLYVVATHSGITLAPLLGKLVAREVNGSKQPVLNPFRPTRFATIKPITPPTHARTAGAQ